MLDNFNSILISTRILLDNYVTSNSNGFQTQMNKVKDSLTAIKTSVTNY